MKKTLPAERLGWSIGYGIVGTGFFFSIIGVFGFGVAIGSLILFVALAIASIRHPRGTES